MKNLVYIFRALIWAIKIRKDVDKIVVYQIPNEVTQTPSRIFYVQSKYFE